MNTRPFISRLSIVAQFVGAVTIVLFAVQGFLGLVGAAPQVQQAVASTPAAFNFQGIARDAEGNLLSSGDYAMTFRIYAGMTEATPLWQETLDGVAVRDGRFSATLGSTTPIPSAIFNGADRFVGVTIAGGAELQPRQRLSSVPYAITADLLDGRDSADFANASHTHPANQITGVLSDAQVADTLTLTGGGINNVPIGQTTPAAGNFTNLSAAGLVASGAVSTGDLTTEGDLTVRGELSVEGPKPFFFRRVQGLASVVPNDTGISRNDYLCGVVGVETGSGDIEETGSGQIMQFQVVSFANSPNWHIATNFRTTSLIGWEVDLLCISTALADFR